MTGRYVEQYISPFIKHQFPSFYRDEGGKFITFVEAYYEWMEDNGLLTKSRNVLDYRDIDTTLDEFVTYFKNKYIKNIPENIRSDKRLLIKHILEVYRSKGTEASYKFLFKLLYNEEIELYKPWDDTLKLSESTWVLPKYIEVTNSEYLLQMVGKKIVGTKNGTTAVVENYSKQYINQRLVSVLELSNIIGKFSYKEKILCPEISEITVSNAPMIVGSLSTIVINAGGKEFSVGDYLNVTSATGRQSLAKVATTKDQNGIVRFNLVDGGTGISLNATITVTGGGGTGASFKVGSLRNTEIITIVEDVIDNYINKALEETSNGYTVELSGVTGTFSNGEYIYSSTDVSQLSIYRDYLDFVKLETVSNSSLGISATVSHINETYLELIDITGIANLVIGTQLSGDSSGAVATVESIFDTKTYEANGVIEAIDGANVTVTSVGNGYFSVGGIANGDSSGASGTIENVTRITDWGFPTYKSVIQNLDTLIGDTLTYQDLLVGTIKTLTSIAGGNNYISGPSVSVIQQNILDLNIPDGKGGYKGQGVIIDTEAGLDSGVIKTVQVIDSGFAYENLQPLTLTHATNPSYVTGVAYVTNEGISEGYWEDHKSFTSDHVKIQDSKYYQKFSYDIISSKLLSSYEKVVRDLIHPTGISLFGSLRIKDVQQDEISIVSEQKLYSSYSNSNISYSLTSS